MLARKTSDAAMLGGYTIANVTIIAVAALLGMSSSVIPVELIGYLGVIPIGLGLYSLLVQLRGPAGPAEAPASSGAALGVAATLVANSVDSIIVFAPMIADSKASLDPFIALAFLVVAAAWFWMAKVASQHASRLDVLTRAAGWLAPPIMIYVGIYILMNTATDVL
jgi:cadmium resistance protein CadD (predicted permease)